MNCDSEIWIKEDMHHGNYYSQLVFANFIVNILFMFCLLLLILGNYNLNYKLNFIAMGLGLHKNNRLYSNSDSESDSDDPDTNILTDSINENDVPDELLKMTPLNNENSFLKLFGY